MQLRTMLTCMLVVNGISFSRAVRCDDGAGYSDTSTTVEQIYTTPTVVGEQTYYYYEPYNYETYYEEEITCDGYYVEDEYIYEEEIDTEYIYYEDVTMNCNEQEEAWIPTFPPLDKVPTYAEIITLTNQNEALFNTQIAYANQALEAYLRQCIVNGAYDEQQIANLINTIKNVYMVFVRQSAFLAYAKNIRLQNEVEYQAYQAQLAALATAVQQAAQQAGDAWYAVVQGANSAANALSVSEDAAAAIATNQDQMTQIGVQISALLATLAAESYGYDYQA